jgi:hypothetical protein
MFRICSEFWVIFRIFRHFSEFLEQKLVYSESLDFVVPLSEMMQSCKCIYVLYTPLFFW